MGGLLLGALLALLRTPSWYDPPSIATADKQKVRNNLVAAEQAFTEHLRAGGGPFVYHIFQDDVNRWITMRREIYPLIDELAPQQLVDPLVVLGDNQITVAGRYQAGILDVVVSIDIAITMKDGAIVLKAEGVRCGSVRVPTGFGPVALGETIERDREQTWPGSPRMSGDFLTGLRIESRAWWKNGGIDYRVVDAWVEPSKLCLKIEPLGRHRAAAHNDQD